MEARGDGSASQVPLQRIEVTPTGIVAMAEFGERDGNFNWTERLLLTARGELVDARAGDFGRKIMGAVWTVEAVIEMAATDA